MLCGAQNIRSLENERAMNLRLQAAIPHHIEPYRLLSANLPERIYLQYQFLRNYHHVFTGRLLLVAECILDTESG